MKLFDKEHCELIDAFEKDLKTCSMRGRLDKEDKEMWAKGRIYQNGDMNDLFKLYSYGYEFGKFAERTY